VLKPDTLTANYEPIDKCRIHSVLRLLVTANDVPSLLIPVTLMMEAIRSSETLVLTRGT
jgi:hypothetical protein